MSQSQWTIIANLGDASPLEYGGYFVKVDETGVYAPEVEVLQELPDEVDVDDPEARWTVYRFILEPCTYVDGVLSDNPSHPDYAAWFATPEAERATRPQDTTYLSRIAESDGHTIAELIAGFCSADPIERAWAWREVGDYHGYDELDSYPLTLTRAEVEARYPDYV